MMKDPQAVYPKRMSTGAVTALLILLVLVQGLMSCQQEEARRVVVASVTRATEGSATLTAPVEELIHLVNTYNRLTEAGYTYRYHSPQLVSFPVSPGRYRYFLTMEAKVSLNQGSPVYRSWHFYAELSEGPDGLSFVADNFQQVCFSVDCLQCTLIQYQDGSYGCSCPGDAQDCQYNQNRLLSPKQQKSDII